MYLKALPVLFALLWSTGFIGARFGLPYIEPYTFLAIRFLIAILVLAFLIACLKIKFPRLSRGYLHVFGSGLFIHVAYLGGVFYAIKVGLPVGVTAIIVGMQPILTTLLVHQANLGKILLTSLLGFVGLVCVIYSNNFSLHFDWHLYLPALFALLGITIGTIYQKTKCSEFNIVIIAFLQYIPASLIFLSVAHVFEHGRPIIWNGQLIFALLWLALVLSIGTILLMSWLYRKHSAAKVANFFYLAPPLALLQGHLFFGEPVNAINIFGMILVVVSLYVASRLISK